MKKIAILVLVVALIVGLVYFGLPAQTSAYSPFPKPQPPMPKGPTNLITIAENVTLGPGEAVGSGWLDVKSFRQFRLYAGVMTDGTYPYPETLVIVLQSPLDTGLVNYGGIISYGPHPPHGEWFPNPPWQNSWWVAAGAFEGLYSMISVVAVNESTVNTENVSLYLLRAKE